jgi:Leucine-rich repeat (LRR) protein
MIDCSNKNLTSVPARVDLGASYTVLLLNGNRITTINSSSQFPVKLDTLDLSDNPISSITPDSLFVISQTLTSIKFKNSNFVSLPTALEILDNLETVNIENDVMTFPEPTLAKLSESVESLRLANVGLTSWPDWLQRFVFLRRLYLDGNSRLGNPPEGALDSWRLTLTHLSLSKIGADSFSPVAVLSKLQWLDLSLNNITDTVQFSYDLIPLGNTLQYLDISGNGLTTEPRLAELRVLTEAHLSNNKIASVNTGAFASSIVTIYLDNNQLTSVPGFLNDLPQVQYINLQRNNISRVGSNEFAVNSRLTTIYLGENPISSIDEHAFDNTKVYLLYLNLESTRLARVPLALKSLSRLQTLWMPNNNLLVCSCDEKALLLWLNTTPYIKIAGECGGVDIKEFFTIQAAQCA